MPSRPRIALVAVVLTTVAGGVAQATTPGQNGQVAFRRYADAAQTSGAIFAVNADGSNVRQITQPPPRTVDDRPDWSPDGTRLTFFRCPLDGLCAVHVVNADGSGLRQLMAPCPTRPGPARVPQGCADTANATFAPDGQRILFTRATGRIRHFKRLQTDQIEHSAIGIVGVDGTGDQDLLQLPRYAGDANWPQMSPDGRLIMFERANSPLARPRLARALFVMNADGSGLHRVTPWALRAGDDADWAPDGSRILFRSLSDQPSKRSQYYTVRPDGSGLTQLTHFRHTRVLFRPSFSPDGRQIVFARGDAKGMGDMWTMNADGTHPRPLLQVPEWDSAADWGVAQ